MMTRNEVTDEMEEGELPEDGELVENDETETAEKGKEKIKQSKTRGAASESSVHTSASTSAREEARVEPSGGDGPEDVTEFLKKKRKWLAEKVKDQLRTESRVSGDSVNDDDVVKKQAKTSETIVVAPEKPTKSKSSSSSSKNASKESSSSIAPRSTSDRERSSGHKSESSHGSKYRHLDEVNANNDPNETMVSNWLKGSSKKSSRKRPSLESPPDDQQADPNEEYYGINTIASPSPIDSSNAKDQDYRMVGSGDQDYRIAPSQSIPQFDVDYRRDHVRRRHSEEDSIGDFDEAMRRPMAPLSSDRNEFGDIDERLPPTGGDSRHERRSKRPKSDDSDSGSPDDEHDRRGSKRRRSPGLGGRRRGPPPSTKWTGERPICKFYREGFCREGDSCLFSHDMKIEKRPELCRFYMSGYCRNGNRCPYLHGEYPCKEFHKGEECRFTSKGEECRFSHEPLNEMTKPLFDQMLKDEELAAKVSVPNAKSTRKVLLGAPPPPPQPTMPMNMSPRHEPMRGSPPMLPPSGDYMRQRYRSPSPPMSYPSMQFDQFGPNQGPPPPPFFNNPPMHGRPISPPYGMGGPMNPSFMQPPGPPMEPFRPAFSHAPPNQLPMDPGSGGPADNVSSMDITKMLRQIKAEVKGEDIEESPASPEPCSEVQNFNTQPKTIAHVVYRLIPVDVQPVNKAALSAALLQASGNDSKLKLDPRLKNLLSNSTEALPQQSSRDPRSRAARDPRLSRQQPATTTNATPDLYGLQQQVPQAPIDSGMRFDPSSGIPVAVLDPNLAPPPAAAPFFPALPNPGFPAAPNMLIPPGGWMPQMNLVTAATPAVGMPPINVQNYLETIRPPQFPSIPPAQFNNGSSSVGIGASSSPPQLHHYSGPLMADSPPGKSTDPRSVRNIYQARRRPSASPSQQTNDDGDSRNSYAKRFGQKQDQPSDPQIEGLSSNENALSLRERRKDLQYESPLN